MILINNDDDDDDDTQAAVVYSCIWAVGGCLETEDDRAIFDTSKYGQLFILDINTNLTN